MTKPIILRYRESIYIKKSKLDSDLVDDLTKKYTYYFYEEKACEKCEYLIDRPTQPTDICLNCAAFKGGAVLAKQIKINDVAYISTPIGDAKGLRKVLEDNGYEPTVKKHFPQKEMSKAMKFTGTLKPKQVEAVDAILKIKRGVCKAPPRSGKTVLATAAICEIGQKTIIMASQRDWLVGFYETFVGSKTQIPLTSASKLKVGFARTYEEFLKYDVCLVTTQTFWSEKGQKLLRKSRNLWNVAVFDEVHTAAASKYASVISQLNCEYKIGLSGTPNRKDGRFTIARALIGPNLYDMKVERLIPHVQLVRTGYVKNYRGQVQWASLVGAIEGDKKRLNLIADFALKDVKNGHLVLIPLTRVKCINELIKIINQKAGTTMAYPFYGDIRKDQRDLTIERARNYKIKIIVGNTKLLSTGINIPRASMIYEASLSSNIENCEQRISRILTPWEDKPPPGIRLFLDNMDIRRKCMMNEWFRAIVPIFKPKIADRDRTALQSYFKEKTANSPNAFDL